MRAFCKQITRYLPLLAALLCMDALAALLLWLVDMRALVALAPLLLLVTLIVFGGLVAVLGGRQKRREHAFADFLSEPDAEHEARLRRLLPAADADALHQLAEALRARDAALRAAEARQAEYASYVELWAHEIKTPLALLTLVLDNRRSELAAPVAYKLDYVRNRTQELVSTMLCYARLRSARKDYRLEWLDLAACIDEVCEDYAPLLEEKGFCVDVRVGDARVYADRRGLVFILSQLVSNSANYAQTEPSLTFAFAPCTETDACTLLVTDNGPGVRPCDLAFVFERGFTGNSGSHSKRSTGMGLYLAREVARDIGLTIDAHVPPAGGFQVSLTFPALV